MVAASGACALSLTSAAEAQPSPHLPAAQSAASSDNSTAQVDTRPVPLDESAADEASAQPSDTDRALALGVGIFPGFLVHGTGSFLLGRPETGLYLLLMEGAGVGLILAGVTTLFATGAGRDIAGPAATATIAGAGLFTISFLGDLYGTVAPDGGWGQAARVPPVWQAESGYRYVYDPRFEYRDFLMSGFDVRAERWRLSPSLWASPDDANSRYRLEAAYRPWGPSRATRSRDGSHVEVELALTEHHYPRERFTLSTVEWFVRGRLDLERVADHLAGAFGELGAGTAYQVTRFEVSGADDTGSALLLARFAFGIYVGDQRHGGGEWLTFYDHRHDDLAGGLLMPGVGSGPGGHWGFEGFHFFDEHWGLGAEFQAGSAVVVGLSGLFRHWGAQ